MLYEVLVNGIACNVELTHRDGKWVGSLDGEPFEVDAVPTARDILSLLEGGKAWEVKRERALNGDLHLLVGSARYACEIRDPRSLRSRRRAAATGDGPQKITAPMPGRIVRLLVVEGDEVAAGQSLVVVEAMKMQNELKSPKAGRVQRLLAVEGATANAGEVLAIVD